jgi:hypothetical protein
MGSPFQGPYCLCYLPLVWPGAVLGYEVVREVIYPFPWFVPLAGQFPSRRRPVLHARRLPRRISTFGRLRELRGGRLFAQGTQYKNSPLGS